MMKLSEKDRILIDSFQNDFIEDKKLQAAIRDYTEKHGLRLPDNAEYSPGIDFVELLIGDESVLCVYLPPVSNYTIHETEHTSKYLPAKLPIAI